MSEGEGRGMSVFRDFQASIGFGMLSVSVAALLGIMGSFAMFRRFAKPKDQPNAE